MCCPSDIISIIHFQHFEINNFFPWVVILSSWISLSLSVMIFLCLQAKPHVFCHSAQRITKIHIYIYPHLTWSILRGRCFPSISLTVRKCGTWPSLCYAMKSWLNVFQIEFASTLWVLTDPILYTMSHLSHVFIHLLLKFYDHSTHLI